uniref:SCP domain-containing protein n=1 Tax=Strongyloides venezuelensis TaxID=75913 RepID=A0A0K0FX41_STRVS
MKLTFTKFGMLAICLLINLLSCNTVTSKDDDEQDIKSRLLDTETQVDGMLTVCMEAYNTRVSSNNPPGIQYSQSSAELAYNNGLNTFYNMNATSLLFRANPKSGSTDNNGLFTCVYRNSDGVSSAICMKV